MIIMMSDLVILTFVSATAIICVFAKSFMFCFVLSPAGGVLLAKGSCFVSAHVSGRCFVYTSAMLHSSSRGSG